jgi:hypothetical protein
MSPEQAAGVTGLGPRTDVFGLGVVAYELVVGQLPGRWLSDEAVRVGKFLDAEPAHRTRLDRLPGAAEEALTRALAVSESARFAGPVEFAKAFEAAFGDRPRYRETDARAIVGRAAELEAAHVTEADRLTMGGVQRLAAEVGIPPEHVRAAAAELARHPDSAPVKPELLGGRKRSTVVERSVPHDVDPAVYPALVQEMALSVGEGLVSTLGQDLRWRTSVRAEMPRNVAVTISGRSGGTKITIEDRNDDLMGGWGIGGGLGGMFGSIVIGVIAKGALESPMFALVGIPIWLAVSVLAARAGFRKGKADRRVDLEGLADRLAAGISSASSGPKQSFPTARGRPIRTPE